MANHSPYRRYRRYSLTYLLGSWRVQRASWVTLEVRTRWRTLVQCRAVAAVKAIAAMLYPSWFADGGPATLARLYNPLAAVPDGLGGPGILIAGVFEGRRTYCYYRSFMYIVIQYRIS